MDQKNLSVSGTAYFLQEMFWYIPFRININAQNQIFHSQNAFQNSAYSLNMHNFLLTIDITMSLLYKLLVKTFYYI